MTAKTSFETLLKKLEKIVQDLEDGELPLEKALARFEDGMKLTRQCSTILDATEKKITTLMENADGDVVEEPFVTQNPPSSTTDQT